MKKDSKYITLFSLIICLLLLVACDENTIADSTNRESTYNIGEIPQVSLNFALQPYPDHTDAIVAMEKGWFEDVGIDLNTSVVDAEQVSSVLVAGTVDVASSGPALLMPSMKQQEFQTFVFGNLFRGYAIMAQPDEGYKTFQDFISEGMSNEEAIKETIGQMKGKVFTYPAEAAIKPFIDLVFEKADMDLTEVISDVQQDSNGVTLMLSKRADFKVGGVPSRLTLEAEGMIPIISSADIVKSAEPSGDSIEIRSIQHVGWSTTKEWQDENHDTILRLASVRFRLNEFYKDNPEEAAEIHIPYLNKEAGINFTIDEGLILYESQIPTYTFDEQDSWFNNELDPLYWEYEIQSNMNAYEEQGVFEEGEFDPHDLVSAESIYSELVELKKKTEENLSQLNDAEGEVLNLKELAQEHYDIFNFLDSYRFSTQALELMNE